MAEKSKTQWTDATWNVAVGCTKVDEDCKNCYMYRESLKGTRYEPKEVRKTKTVFNLPLSSKLKEPSRIFTSSLTDFFHEAIDEYRHEAWDIIRKCPQHTFQILTKRPERVIDNLPEDWGDGWDNVWIGTSVGSSKSLHRIETLSKIPSKIRFVSFEPLHDFVALGEIHPKYIMAIDWAIIGGESGNETGMYKYRMCQIKWIEYLIEILKGFNKAVFVKQLGTYLSKELKLSDRHGGNIDEWPDNLKIREFPNL